MRINILDTNTYIEILKDGLVLEDYYFITEDLSDEFQAAEEDRDAEPGRQSHIITLPLNCHLYTKCYRARVNQHYSFPRLKKKRSLGDWSVLALLDYCWHHPVHFLNLLAGAIDFSRIRDFAERNMDNRQHHFIVYLAYPETDRQFAGLIQASPFRRSACVALQRPVRRGGAVTPIWPRPINSPFPTTTIILLP